MKRLLLAISATVCLSVQAGSFWDGNKLHNKLRGDIGDQMQALGYIMGVADAGESVSICEPNNVTAGQMHDIMKNYLESAPAVRHLAADSLITVVLGRVWPCEKKRGNAL